MKYADKMKNVNTTSSNDNEKHSEEMLSLIDAYKLLQKNFPNFTDEDLKHEMVTMYSTGTDTVGQVAASCLLALAYHPVIQEKVFQEIMAVVGQDGDVTSEDLPMMPYLDQVCKETLRFFLIVPLTARKTTEDITLGPHFIPAGVTLVLALEGLNLDPKVFKNPKTFDPEHFSKENTEAREKNRFIPFSAGPRNCIGKRYADILLKIIVVHVLRKFKLSTTMDIHNMKKQLSITLLCTEGYNISLEPRVI